MGRRSALVSRVPSHAATHKASGSCAARERPACSVPRPPAAGEDSQAGLVCAARSLPMTFLLGDQCAPHRNFPQIFVGRA